jgi:hypothetical protein
VQSGEPHSLILTPYIPIIDVKDDDSIWPLNTSIKSGRSGKGSILDMSPLSMLISYGSASRLVLCKKQLNPYYDCIQ